MQSGGIGAAPTFRGTATGLYVGVLGPLQVEVGGRPVSVRTGRLRALLAVLAMSAGTAVPAERLAAAVWGEDLPNDARRSVQLYITRLRGLLGGEAIETGPDGYLLNASAVDALRFLRLLDAATGEDDRGRERAALAQALTLWRGTPFDGLKAAWLEQVEGPRLIDRYVAATERRIDLDLAAGLHGAAVPQLRELTARYPLRERFWGQLMTALYRSGRQADALDAYRQLYRLLGDELGLPPSPTIRELHRRILTADVSLRVPESRTTAAVTPVPRQLPPGVRAFSGRSASLAQLDGPLRRARDGASIVVIAGGAGVGKTALAVHWAHQIADRFPDGQLYVDLRGFGPSGGELRPGEVVRGFLEAFGVPPSYVPTGQAAQVGLYRSILAGKRVLILLDNAADAEQVRPLLPGSPGCVAVVTSRYEMPGLVAEGAYPVRLDVLSDDESRELLACRLGPDRIASEPDAVAQIIRICAGLPLALAIVLARIKLPRISLEAFANELGEFHTSLDALASADTATDIRGVFSWSYQRLSPAAQRLFRLLSMHPGTDAATMAVASLAGVTVSEVRPPLAELCRAHLLTENRPSRYTFHDLLRAYATELSHQHDSESARKEAQTRLLDHYLRTAGEAALLIEPLRDPIRLVPPAPDVTPERFAERDEALAWFHAERSSLLSLTEAALAGGFANHAWQMVWALADYLQWQGRWHERVATLLTALAAARQLGDRTEQARAHRCLGTAYTKLELHDQAHTHLRQALRLYLKLGDIVGQVRTHQSLSNVLERQGTHKGALWHVQRALALYPPTGSKAGLGRLLNSAGWCHAQLGNLPEALSHCEKARALAQQAGDRVSEAATLDSIGYVRYRSGEHDEAVRSYRQALALRRAIGHRVGEANTLTRMGDAHEAMGDLSAARRCWQDSLAILENAREPGVDAVRARLSRFRGRRQGRRLAEDVTEQPAPA